MLVGRTWQNGYGFHPFKIKKASNQFEFSRAKVSMDGVKAVGSNICAIWTPHQQQTLVNGVLAGRKQFDPRGASFLCRREVLQSLIEVAGNQAGGYLADLLPIKFYSDLKTSWRLEQRRAVKNEVTSIALKGWLKNDEDKFECRTHV